MKSTSHTARSLLVASGSDEATLEAFFVDHDASRTAIGAAAPPPGAMLQALDAEIARKATQLLDVSLGETVVKAWRGYTDLRAAAYRTRAGGCEVITLARHRINTVHRPWIELRCLDALLGRIDFELTVDLTLSSVVAVVDSGRLAKVRSGECSARAAFTHATLGTIAAREKQFPAPAVVQLKRPVRLLRRREAVLAS